jgi:cephalosporin-C deacetylase
MPRTDMAAGDLRAYAPSLPEPADLASFWPDSLAQAAQRPVAASFAPVDSGLRTISSYDLTFTGYGSTEIRAWLHLPSYWSPHDDALPVVV